LRHNFATRLACSLIAFVCIQSAAFAQGAEDEVEISRLVASQMLVSGPLSNSEIQISNDARETLIGAGMVGNRFVLDSTTIMESKADGAEQAVTAVAVFQEETSRRLWLVVRAWYKVTNSTVYVSRAEVYWNSPDVPEVQMRMVPSGAIPLNSQPANSYAQCVSLIDEILSQAIDPAAVSEELGDAALIFIDRVAFDADVVLTLSETAEGEPTRVLETVRLEATGWPILIVESQQLSEGFLQVRYRAGSDRSSASSEHNIIAAYVIGDGQ
jgi:hypothetical protein